MVGAHHWSSAGREGCYSHLVGQPGVEEGGAGVLGIAIRFP